MQARCQCTVGCIRYAPPLVLLIAHRTMIADIPDSLMRTAVFDHVRRLCEVHDHLTAIELKPGFTFRGERIPLINPQRGIFKPQQTRYLLSIKTVYPKPGGKVWYDDQREVHRQIFQGDETVDYAFMGQDPNAADTVPNSGEDRSPDWFGARMDRR
jgi:putative restriction endonuclease